VFASTLLASVQWPPCLIDRRLTARLVKRRAAMAVLRVHGTCHRIHIIDYSQHGFRLERVLGIALGSQRL
jgi:hypothetical protein